MRLLCVPLVVFLLSACSVSPNPTSTAPTLVVVNGRVWTGDAQRPWADAIAVTGERITAVGSSAEIRKLAKQETRVVDAAGGLVAPGFIDSHVHFIEGGFGLTSVQLRDASSKEEFIRRIRVHAAGLPAGAWLLEGNWDHQNWGGELPRRDWIDSVTPNTPVFIQRLDGHMALANSAALRAAKVGSDTKDVAGGEIVRANGEPTGILKDNAMSLVGGAIPDPLASQEDAALDAAMTHVAERGVTSVHNMGTWRHVAIFERAHKAQRLRTRIYAAVPLATWAQLRDRVTAAGRGDHWFHIGGLKGFVDGSLGSHTALMLEPFSDTPNDKGLFVTPPESLYAWTKAADLAGLHVIIHAIGDRANRELLDIYERVARENPPRATRRFRIEHAQHLAPAEIPRFGALGVIPSMQPYHAIDDGRWADRFLGPERVKGTYAFRSLLDTGAKLTFGSDWFVAPPTPLEGIYAAVTRRTLDDKRPGGWVPAQKITVEEALRAYTAGGAYAEFMEQEKGLLARGMLADIVVIDRDLTSIPPETIRDARVMLTVVGGRVVYERTR
jgi:predicted amidohydrolase YtcJ